MKLKNILFVVKDIEISKAFYKELFGLEVIADFGENVVLTEGLVLQEQKLWEKFINKEICYCGNDAELYFEEEYIDDFLKKLENCSYGIEYINKCIEHDWGQRAVRICDPDGHIIEIGETDEGVIRRLLNEGLTIEQISKKARLPVAQIEELVISLQKK